MTPENQMELLKLFYQKYKNISNLSEYNGKPVTCLGDNRDPFGWMIEERFVPKLKLTGGYMEFIPQARGMLKNKFYTLNGDLIVALQRMHEEACNGSNENQKLYLLKLAAKAISKKIIENKYIDTV